MITRQQKRRGRAECCRVLEQNRRHRNDCGGVFTAEASNVNESEVVTLLTDTEVTAAGRLPVAVLKRELTGQRLVLCLNRWK